MMLKKIMPMLLIPSLAVAAVDTPNPVTFHAMTGDAGPIVSFSHNVPSGTTALAVVFAANATEVVNNGITWNGQALTLVSDLDPGTNSEDAKFELWCLMNPSPVMANVVVDLGQIAPASWYAAMNFTGTVAGSCAQAFSLLSSDLNTAGTETQSVHASAGTPGNALIFVGNAVGDDEIPASNNASFVEILEDNTGGGFGNPRDFSAYIAERLNGAPSGITVTWAGPDESASGLFEVVAAAGGNGWVNHLPSYDPIVRGHAGWGFDWSSYLATDPDYDVIYITNRNTSGAGSLDACISGTSGGELRICVPKVSGMIDYPQDTLKGIVRDNLIVAMHVAPSPGLYTRDVTMRLRGNRQLWMHYSCFQGQATTQPTGKCIELQNQDAVILNGGFAFGTDGGIDAWTDADRTSIVHTMSVYPVGASKFCSLWGPDSGAADRALFARNVCAHSNGRQIKINGIQNSAVYNNVMYNVLNNFTELTNGDGGGVGFDVNIESTLYVDGANTASSLEPIIIRNNIEAGTRLWLMGNREFGLDASESPQTALVDDQSGGIVNYTGSRIASAHPPGFSVTPIGAGDQGEEDFMTLVCRDAGPRPADRLPYFQLICDQLQNRFDGTGPTGTIIANVANHPLGGIPSIAQNTCNPEVANSCGAGKPALPIGNLTGADTHINRFFTWLADTHCAVMPAGATGC